VESSPDVRIAIATLCVGSEYSGRWDKYASRNWRAYAERNGYALEVFREPLDGSLRAAARSPAWQKCLILGQPALRRYDRVVWIDSDVIITGDAPDITRNVPAGRIGCVISGDYIQREMKARLLERLRHKKLAPDMDIETIWSNDQKLFYQQSGITAQVDEVVQTGVLVLGHDQREMLEAVYRKDYSHSIVAHEQFPLSAEIINRGLLHRIDSRFNLVFYERMIVHYPYLLDRSLPQYGYMAHLAVMTEYTNAFFLHFAYDQSFAQFLNPEVY
jgi:hypothetical protein